MNSPASAAAARTPGASFVSPAALMAVRSLELRARMVVEGFWHGIHRSPYHGFSVEFTEYRAYTPGDDPRFVDWRLCARTDRLYVRRFEDETNLRCHLLVDLSRSMDFGTTGWSKADYARTLAATLGRFLGQQGDAVGLLTFDERVRDWLPARNRPGHLRQLMLALEKPAGGGSTDYGAPLRRVVELVRKRGLVVLLTDLLAPLAPLEARLAELTACGHEVVVFQILDRAEVSLEFGHAALFEDAESGRELYVEPEAARAGYARRFAAHNTAARAVCEKMGAGWREVLTDRPLELALHDFLSERRARGRRTVRRSPR